ncbi:MAG: hypothetical protein HQL96_13510 [Magnetococcales bacterium]|nr:hypothetical protein [Magnetococcales bacterium]
MIEELDTWLKSPEQRELRRAFAKWLSRILLPRLAKKNVSVPEAMPEMDDLEEVRTMLAETAEGWTREWKQEGRHDGNADMLLKLMRRKFGSTPDWVTEKVRSADLELMRYGATTSSSPTPWTKSSHPDLWTREYRMRLAHPSTVPKPVHRCHAAQERNSYMPKRWHWNQPPASIRHPLATKMPLNSTPCCAATTGGEFGLEIPFRYANQILQGFLRFQTALPGGFFVSENHNIFNSWPISFRFRPGSLRTRRSRKHPFFFSPLPEFSKTCGPDTLLVHSLWTRLFMHNFNI